ncbi:MAG: nicotinamide mononucleotide transporter [Lachnospiraceae bacterium]|nr:nicotinamide mononucleotide transporter [Lachnospiraceae bacterium]
MIEEINFISAVCGVICIFFTAKADISNFVFAAVNTIVYAIYLVYWHIWGTAALEILFYIPMNFVSCLTV